MVVIYCRVNANKSRKLVRLTASADGIGCAGTIPPESYNIQWNHVGYGALIRFYVVTIG